jgi:hypothetical protein
VELTLAAVAAAHDRQYIGCWDGTGIGAVL